MTEFNKGEKNVALNLIGDESHEAIRTSSATDDKGGEYSELKISRNDVERATAVDDRENNFELTPLADGSLHRIPVRFASTIEDRFANRRFVEPIFRSSPNLTVLSHILRNTSVRDECQSFFLAGTTAAIIRSLFSVKTVTPGEHLITRGDVSNAIRASGAYSAPASLAICEILIPFLVKLDLVGGEAHETFVLSFPHGRISYPDIAADVIGQDVTRVLSSIDYKLPADRKVSPSVLGEEIADAMIAVGRAFNDANDFQAIFDDIVKGVRAHIDPSLAATGFTGSVPSSWRDHPVVAELAKNVVFVRAAMSLAPGSITLTTPDWKLDKMAPLALAAMRSSARYSFVNRADAGRTWSLRKIRSIEGLVRQSVLVRNAHMYAAGMSVYPVQDAMHPTAWRITPTHERIAEAIKLAYSSPATMSIGTAADAYIAVAKHAAESGVGLGNELRVFDIIESTWYTPGGSKSEIDEVVPVDAMNIAIDLLSLKAEKVTFVIGNRVTGLDEEQELGAVTGVSCVPFYTVHTSEKMFAGSWNLAGRFQSGDLFVTPSVTEGFLALGEWEATSAMEERPQMLTRDAIAGGRIEGFDASRELCALKTKVAFSATLNGAHAHGRIVAGELGSMRASTSTAMVVPVYNRAVANGMAAAFSASLGMASKIAQNVSGASGALMARSMSRLVAARVLSVARGVSGGFRGEIHTAMVEKSVIGMSYDDSVRLRATFAQAPFGGYADALALQAFLSFQGISSTLWQNVLQDSDVQSAFFELGTDRPDPMSV